MELLSPAKNLQTAKVAINCGADAVYIGASNFGARKTASNSLSDLEQLCKYAHFYNCRVYVTFNTILYDNELEDAHNLIWQLYNIGVDALIIQDLGILEMDIPPIELHASTQTNNYELKRIKFFDKLGFKRIVLARELSFDQIKEVRNSIQAEIECFIHGALCVCFSGQCYMSYCIGKRSANRGECAQACRLKYSLIGQNGKKLLSNRYLLSLRDLNLGANITKLLKIGVNSLKIEGRLKDDAYVADVTAYYRRLLDSILEENNLSFSSSGKSFYDFIPNVEKVFNRGFTSYFTNADSIGQMANFNSPKSSGAILGKVVFRQGNKLKINTNQSINNGDGLCYIFNGNMYGFRVEKFENGFVYCNADNNLSVGTTISRNFDTEFNKKLENSKTLRKISVVFQIGNCVEGFWISVRDEDGIVCKEVFENQFVLAKNIDANLNTIQSSLSKGGEKFLVEKVEILFDKIPFLQNSVLNNARRLVLQSLENKRLTIFKAKPFAKPNGEVAYFQTYGDYKLNVSNRLAKQFYLNHGCKVVETAFELNPNTSGREVMVTKYCIRRECGFCIKTNKNIPNAWKSDTFILEGPYRNFTLKFDCKECVMRIYS